MGSDSVPGQNPAPATLFRAPFRWVGHDAVRTAVQLSQDCHKSELVTLRGSWRLRMRRNDGRIGAPRPPTGRVCRVSPLRVRTVSGQLRRRRPGRLDARRERTRRRRGEAMVHRARVLAVAQRFLPPGVMSTRILVRARSACVTAGATFTGGRLGGSSRGCPIPSTPTSTTPSCGQSAAAVPAQP